MGCCSRCPVHGNAPGRDSLPGAGQDPARAGGAIPCRARRGPCGTSRLGRSGAGGQSRAVSGAGGRKEKRRQRGAGEERSGVGATLAPGVPGWLRCPHPTRGRLCAVRGGFVRCQRTNSPGGTGRILRRALQRTREPPSRPPRGGSILLRAARAAAASGRCVLCVRRLLK